MRVPLTFSIHYGLSEDVWNDDTKLPIRRPIVGGRRGDVRKSGNVREKRNPDFIERAINDFDLRRVGWYGSGEQDCTRLSIHYSCGLWRLRKREPKKSE